MNITYSWLKLYGKIASKINEYKDNHYGLIEVLRNIGFEDLNDKDVDRDILLDDIDPFTFLSYLNKFGDEKRIYYLQKLSDHWGLGEQINDVCGLPTSNAQKVWLFPYKKDRVNNEIGRLWNLYFSVMEDNVSNEQLFDIVTISSVGWAKISEGLFYLKPKKYLPLNSVVFPYLKSLGLSPVNNSYEAIITTCQNANYKLNKPMYEISYDGWLYADSTKREPQYWRIGTSEGEDSILQEMLDNDVVSIGWTDLGDLSLLGNKSNIQAKLKELYYRDTRNNVVSRKANEIYNFYSNLKANDYVIAMDGMTVKAIAKVYDQRYHYNSSLRFGHIKAVQWMSKDINGLRVDEGLRTTFVKIENRHNIEKIKQYFDGKIASNSNDQDDNDINYNDIDMPLNQILYGPPGTGKTYHTINKALSIIEDKSLDSLKKEKRKDLKDRFKQYVDSGQIVFTTFHQSMSYEDFVEGIKPLVDEDEDGNKQVVYEIQNGIFKDIVSDARKSKSTDNKDRLYTFDDAWYELIQNSNRENENGKNLFLPIQTKNLGLNVVGISAKGNLVLKPIYSHNSKEYIVSYSRVKRLHEVYHDLSLVKNIDKEFRAIIGGSNSTAYWSVLNFINNKISLNAKRNSSTRNVLEPHVLIIDEINRGNVSAIFGELITLIEDSKREGKPEALTVTLPYSKKPFSVPSNLYIIGTMNTADRSVEALDTALRRRFVFEEMLPNTDLEELNYVAYGHKAADILKRINLRIEKLVDRDHCIGHTYFIGKNEETIVESFYKNIIPLLQEYFFGDYGKIGLVLGQGFVRLKKEESNVFADFDYNYVDDLASKPIYEIIDYRISTEEGLSFEKAIQDLMR